MLTLPPQALTRTRLWVPVPAGRKGRYWKGAPVLVHLEGTDQALLAIVLNVQPDRVEVKVESMVRLPVLPGEKTEVVAESLLERVQALEEGIDRGTV